jgi:prepilin-type N-terminal cleavage/methylation domain-containing protein
MSIRTQRPRAFTLIELMAAMVMLGLLYLISLSVFNTSYAGGQQQAAEEQIQTALQDGSRVASYNSNSFPTATISQIVMPSPWSISTGAASGNALSGTVITGGSSNELMVAAYINGTCVLGLATSSATTWATSPTSQSSCVASNFASAAGTILGTKQNPTAIGLP